MTGFPKSSMSKPGRAILIPKQLRLDWIDLMALDASLSHVALRVAAVIAYHLNKHTGKAFLTQEPIAQIRSRIDHLSSHSLFAPPNVLLHLAMARWHFIPEPAFLVAHRPSE